YASKRTIDHLARFNKLHDQFAAGQLNEKFLADCEWRDNLFPNLNWRYYCSGGLSASLHECDARRVPIQKNEEKLRFKSVCLCDWRHCSRPRVAFADSIAVGNTRAIYHPHAV